ncbi:MAG: hypothetical protein WCF90_07960 [Methanomicrobiales archaeon]
MEDIFDFTGGSVPGPIARHCHSRREAPLGKEEVRVSVGRIACKMGVQIKREPIIGIDNRINRCTGDGI